MNKKALFLGSGFSHSISEKYPTLSILTNNVLKGDEIIPSIEETMYSQCYIDIPNICKDNLEILLNYLNQQWPWVDKERSFIYHALYLELINRISLLFNDLKYHVDLDIYKSFAKWIYDNNIDIITLNYDTLVEEIIENWHRDTEYKMFNFASFYSDGGIIPLKSRNLCIENEHIIADCNLKCQYFKVPRIYKLHGSVNWKWSGKNLSDPIYCSWDTYPDTMGTDLIPYIIPPTNNKQNFYGHTVISSIWKHAFNSMKYAEELYIIGFSFPLSDISLKYMFGALLQENPKLKIFVINTSDSINPNSSYFIRDRYETIFGKENCDFSYCCDNSVQLFLDDIKKGKL